MLEAGERAHARGVLAGLLQEPDQPGDVGGHRVRVGIRVRLDAWPREPGGQERLRVGDIGSDPAQSLFGLRDRDVTE